MMATPDPNSPLHKPPYEWGRNEAAEFWREMARLADGEKDEMVITPKHARLLLYAAGP